MVLHYTVRADIVHPLIGYIRKFVRSYPHSFSSEVDFPQFYPYYARVHYWYIALWLLSHRCTGSLVRA